MTQHDESDNKNGEKKKKSKAAWAGFKCHFEASVQVHFQGERLSTHRVGQLHTSSKREAGTELQTSITERVVYVCVCHNPREKNN